MAFQTAAIKLDFGHFEPPKSGRIPSKFGQDDTDEWTRVGYVRGILCNRWEIHPTGKLRKVRSKAPLRGKTDIGGYKVISRWINGHYRVLSFHRISLETYKPKPHPSLECDHRDEVRKNFAIKNLRWVSRALNIAFQKHLGYHRRDWLNGTTTYRVRFRTGSWGTYKTPEAARDRYLYVRAVWMRNERERIIRLVMNYNNYTRDEAIDALNWDIRDDVYFLRELND